MFSHSERQEKQLEAAERTEKESDLGRQLCNREQAGNRCPNGSEGRRSRIITHQKKAEQLKMLQTGTPAFSAFPSARMFGDPTCEHRDLSLDG